MSVYRTAVALSIKGDRVEPGCDVELSADEAAAFDPADLVLVSGIPAEEPEEVEEPAIGDMSHAQLKAKAKELGLSQAGSKADLEERISLHLDGNPREGDEPEGDGPDEDEIAEGDEPEGAITSE